MKSAAAAPAVVVLFALAALAAGVLRQPSYTPDGVVYARFAARDAGYSDRAATLAARKFYESTPLMRSARYRALVELDPSVAFARSRIFSDRVLYPRIVSAMLPFAGFRALFYVNAAAYVLFGLALFWLSIAFGRPWLAAGLAIFALALPVTRDAAASDLSDLLAVIWWTLALGALLRGMREERLLWPLLLALAGILLVLTRPAPYLILLPAAGAALLVRRWQLFAAALASAAAFAVLAAATHAFGPAEQLRWIYTHQPHGASTLTQGAWYRLALLATLRYAAAESVRTVVPVFAIVACIVCLRRDECRSEAIAIALAGAACLLAIPFNPVPSSLARVVFLPMLAVFCAMFQCAASETTGESVPSASRRVPRLARER